MFSIRLPNLRNPFQRDRTLGVARGTRRYDLALANNAGNTFLRLLIGLITLLGILALAASFALSAMTHRWSDGLQNRLSIEIPATDSNGEPVDPGMVDSMTRDAVSFLQTAPSVQSAEVMSADKIKNLLSPWLGSNPSMESIPMPGLISVTLKPDVIPDLKALEQGIKNVAPRAQLDTHQDWLADVLRFTGALKFAALLIAVVIGLTTLVAVAGGVRSNLSENKEELELLHLMGAKDRYIARQMQRHTMILSLQGGGIGMIFGVFSLFAIGMTAHHIGLNLIPDFRLGALQKLTLALLPVAIALLAMLTARLTVMRVLSRMP